MVVEGVMLVEVEVKSVSVVVVRRIVIANQHVIYCRQSLAYDSSTYFLTL